MNNSSESLQEASEPKGQPAAGKKLALAAVFGLIFGFLLQRGGVAKFNVLVGQLLLQDWTVVKVMMTAVVVGMLGVFTLHALGKVKLHLQPTRLGANIVGGLIFGIGFALLAYCPGTGAAALGQGNWDALFGIAGLMAGSYFYAELSDWLGQTVQRWGEKGKLMLPEALHLPRGVTVIGVAIVLTLFLVALGKFTVR
jgi:uncharacterized membrane protein YedE/YeeE